MLGRDQPPAVAAAGTSLITKVSLAFWGSGSKKGARARSDRSGGHASREVLWLNTELAGMGSGAVGGVT